MIIQEIEGSASMPKKKNSCLWKNEMIIREKPSTNKLKEKPKRAEKNTFKSQYICLEEMFINI